MKNWYFVAAIIFIVGEIILFVDSRFLECEVTAQGVLTDFQPDSIIGCARVEIDDKVSAVKNLSYENRIGKKVKLDDKVSLVVKEKAQSIYYGHVKEVNVRNVFFLWRGLRWLLLSAVIAILLKFFKLTL